MVCVEGTRKSYEWTRKCNTKVELLLFDNIWYTSVSGLFSAPFSSTYRPKEGGGKAFKHWPPPPFWGACAKLKWKKGNYQWNLGDQAYLPLFPLYGLRDSWFWKDALFLIWLSRLFWWVWPPHSKTLIRAYFYVFRNRFQSPLKISFLKRSLNYTYFISYQYHTILCLQYYNIYQKNIVHWGTRLAW